MSIRVKRADVFELSESFQRQFWELKEVGRLYAVLSVNLLKAAGIDEKSDNPNET